ncbi:Uncharacterised protein [Vibrio cholerae]|nr:Uncharacterised protein [Vibrio cholerae]
MQSRLNGSFHQKELPAWYGFQSTASNVTLLLPPKSCLILQPCVVLHSFIIFAEPRNFCFGGPGSALHANRQQHQYDSQHKCAE